MPNVPKRKCWWLTTGVSKLQFTSWTQAYFCKLHFIGTRPHFFISILFMVPFMLQRQTWIDATQTAWPTKKKKPKVFTIWGLDGKSANSWPRTKTGIDSISESTPSVQQVGLTCRRRLCVDQIQLCNINLLGAAVDIFVLAANYLSNWIYKIPSILLFEKIPLLIRQHIKGQCSQPNSNPCSFHSSTKTYFLSPLGSLSFF